MFGEHKRGELVYDLLYEWRRQSQQHQIYAIFSIRALCPSFCPGRFLVDYVAINKFGSVEDNNFLLYK